MNDIEQLGFSSHMSFEEYDDAVDTLQHMAFQPSRFATSPNGIYFPSTSEIRKYIHMPEDLDFCMWLLECQKSTEPMTEDQKKSQKLIRLTLYDNLDLQ